jgi:hypothetical protein
VKQWPHPQQQSAELGVVLDGHEIQVAKKYEDQGR